MQIDYDRVTELVRQTKSLVLNSRQAAKITVKGRADYVTQVDFSVQEYLVGALKGLYLTDWAVMV